MGNVASSTEVQSKDLSNAIYDQAQNRMKLLPGYYQWICQSFQKHLRGDVVELGVGAGLIIENYIQKPAVKTVLGVDFNETLLERLRQTYPTEKVTMKKVDLRDDWKELGHQTADTVLALDVVEHFEDDLSFAKKIHSLLRTDGLAIIKVPAQPELFSSVDESSGHYRRYSTESLGSIMREAGFEPVQQGYFNLVGSLIYPLKKNSNKNFSKTFSPWKIRLANILIPLISSLDTLFKVKPLQLKGLSVVGVYKKIEA